MMLDESEALEPLLLVVNRLLSLVESRASSTMRSRTALAFRRFVMHLCSFLVFSLFTLSLILVSFESSLGSCRVGGIAVVLPVLAKMILGVEVVVCLGSAVFVVLCLFFRSPGGCFFNSVTWVLW